MENISITGSGLKPGKEPGLELMVALPALMGHTNRMFSLVISIIHL
jgi:hypothetical protein